jgi:hypothetical protein
MQRTAPYRLTRTTVAKDRHKRVSKSERFVNSKTSPQTSPCFFQKPCLNISTAKVWVARINKECYMLDKSPSRAVRTTNLFAFFSAAVLVALLYLIWSPIQTVDAACCKTCGFCKTTCTTRALTAPALTHASYIFVTFASILIRSDHIHPAAVTPVTASVASAHSQQLRITSMSVAFRRNVMAETRVLTATRGGILCDLCDPRATYS